MGLVKIRISGSQADIEAVIAFLLDTEAVMKFPKLLSKSDYYDNRRDPGLRCYLDFLIEGEQAYDATLVNPQLPQD